MTFRVAARAALIIAAASRADAMSLSPNRIETAGLGMGFGITAAPDGTMFVAGTYRVGSSNATLAGVWRYRATGGAAVWTVSGTGVAGGTSLFEQSARAIAIVTGATATAYDLIVGGALYTGAGTSADAWLARITSAGAPVWSLVRNGPASEDDAINGVAVAPSGDLIVDGRVGVNPGDADAWIARFNSNGVFLGEMTYSAALGADEEALAVATDASGSVYVVGYVTIPGSGKNAWIAKLDPGLSAIEWARSVNGASSSTDYFTGVAVDSATGGVTVAGVVTGAVPFTDILVKRYDAATGNEVWTRTLDGGEGDNDTASACALAPDGDVVVAGAVDRPTSAFSDIWLARFAPDGSTRWELTRDSQNAYIDEARGITVDGLGVVRATGFVRGYQTTNGDDPRLWVGAVLDLAGPPPVTPAPGAYAMPNPFRPGSGGQFDAAAITIRGVPAGATVRIYTILGGRVAELTDADRDGVVQWDANGDGGDPAASGVYLWVADGGSAGTARGKVVIVR